MHYQVSPLPYPLPPSPPPPLSTTSPFMTLSFAKELLGFKSQSLSVCGADLQLFLLQITEGEITDPFVLNWLDLLCFLLSGLPANGTIAAEVAFMFNEWYRPGSALEIPRGGSQAMVNALVRQVNNLIE